jgi:asparagine synthase (glutamine-hydrolysing)
VDVEHGAQPMFGQRGEVLVFNGEIYNYPELRRKLEADGVLFATHCDTEVILHLYARVGMSCVDHLNGMFAFALWDPEQECLFFARDRLGEKPFYWADAGGRFIFGSEIKALLAHPSVMPRVNEAVLGPYLTNLVSSAPATLFDGIYKLSPGHLGVCDCDGVRTRRYWTLFGERSWTGCEPALAASEVRGMLEHSVHDRLMSDVPVGVLLSGGVDSTTLVALLHERARDLATFCVGFRDHPELDEREEARRVAKHFGTDHHEVAVTEADALAFLGDLVHHQDEPLADPVCLPLHFICHLARRSGVKVLLAGEGADELFWGYPRYQMVLERWPAVRAILALPSSLRRLLPRLVRADRKPYVREYLESLASGRPPPAHLPLGFSRYHRELFLRDGGDDAELGWTPSADTGQPRASHLSRLAFDTQEYEFGLRLPELLLMRIDRFSMANSVEARVPFLDPGLVEYVYRLPLEHKLHRGRTKVVLRDAIADIVPQWVLERPKRGFGAPVVSWMGSSFGDLFRDLLREESMQRYFDVGELGRALDPRRNTAFSLWPILNFALWHRQWIEGEPLGDRIEAAATSLM